MIWLATKFIFPPCPIIAYINCGKWMHGIHNAEVICHYLKSLSLSQKKNITTCIIIIIIIVIIVVV
jgi:hypothetical protein